MARFPRWIGFYTTGVAIVGQKPGELNCMDLGAAPSIDDAAVYFARHTRNSDTRIAVCKAPYADVIEEAIRKKLAGG